MKLYTLDIKELDIKAAEHIKIKGIDKKIYIEKQKTGFGYKHFLVCPDCGSNREKLYITDTKQTYCRTCAPKEIQTAIYRGITHTTRGGTSEMEYRMSRVAAAYNIPLEYPFSYLNVALERPKYMRVKKWTEGIRKLQILENMRNQTIFFNEKYDAKLIQKIFDDYLYYYTIQELKDYFYNWHKFK